MKNTLTRIAFLTVVPFLIAGCGTLLPDRLIYPADMKSKNDDKKKETVKEKKKSESPERGTAGLVEESTKNEPAAPEPPVAGRSKKRKSIDALPSDIGHNALMRLFNAPFEETWNVVVETMMPLNLSAVDKSSGVLITGWIQDDRRTSDIDPTLGMFGDVVRYVRYKYIVRVSDVGGGTRVVVVPFAQVTKNLRWRQGKPKVEISEMLMRKLMKKMEER